MSARDDEFNDFVNDIERHITEARAVLTEYLHEMFPTTSRADCEELTNALLDEAVLEGHSRTAQIVVALLDAVRRHKTAPQEVVFEAIADALTKTLALAQARQSS